LVLSAPLPREVLIYAIVEDITMYAEAAEQAPPVEDPNWCLLFTKNNYKVSPDDVLLDDYAFDDTRMLKFKK
jgi:hypothetical protein